MKFNNFCPVPFTQLQLSSDSTYKPCCRYEGSFESDGKKLLHPHTNFEEAWTSKSLAKLRSEFIAGARPEGCRECWQEEAIGHYSLRKIRLKNYSTTDLERLVTHEPTNTPRSLDIKLSNLCNLKCRICAPSASSTWEEEIRRLEDPTLKIYHDKIINAENYATIVKWLPKIDRIEIFGGEPLVNSEFYKILELCVVHGRAKEITIHCNTNGTVFASKYIRLFEHFKRVSIYFSIDDISERFTYQRNPASWELVLENLKKYSQIVSDNTEFAINCTVSLFNIYYLPEFVQWAHSQSFFTGFNILHLPEHFSIVNLPSKIKTVLIDRLQRSGTTFGKNCANWDALIQFLKSPGDELQIFKALQEIQKIDRYRNQEFASTFPEFWELIRTNVQIEQYQGLRP